MKKMILTLALVLMTSVSMFGVKHNRPNIKKDGRPCICHVDKHGKKKHYCKECKKVRKNKKKDCHFCNYCKRNCRMKIDRKCAKRLGMKRAAIASGRR